MLKIFHKITMKRILKVYFTVILRSTFFFNIKNLISCKC